MGIDQNNLANAIGRGDVGHERSSLGQRKQLVKLTLDEIARYPLPDVMELIRKHGAQWNWRVVPNKGVVVMKRAQFVLGAVAAAIFVVLVTALCVMGAQTGHRQRKCATDCRCGCKVDQVDLSPMVVCPPPSDPWLMPIPMPEDHRMRITAIDLVERIKACTSYQLTPEQVSAVLDCTFSELAKLLESGDATESDIISIVESYQCRQ